VKAVLLAAGLGTRLRPLTDTVPKCLVPIHGRPLLDYWIDQLTTAGISSFVINTHYLPRAVEAHVSQSPARDRITLVHEEQLLGTGGTLLANRRHYAGETILVAHADNLCVCDFGAFLRGHDRRPAAAVMTMMTFATDRPSSCGIVSIDGSGIVRAFEEKPAHPTSNLANGAVYIFEPAVIELLCQFNRDVVDLSTEVIPQLVGRINTWHNDQIHHDIGTYAGLAAAEQSLAAGGAVQRP
jgi:mannose-1-phosphate guanylyltransferase